MAQHQPQHRLIRIIKYKRPPFIKKEAVFLIFLLLSLQYQKICLSLHPQTTNNGAIAQLVEQRTENPCVPGSIPGGTTKIKICEL